MRWLIVLAMLVFGPAVSAQAQGAGDPVCAEYKRHWEQVSSGGNLTAMAQAAAAISPACAGLKAEVAGRLAEARRRIAEHNQAAQAEAIGQRAASEEAKRERDTQAEAARVKQTAANQASREQRSGAVDDAAYEIAKQTMGLRE